MEGTREPSSFLQWQKEMREKDLQEELAKIERRRLERRISYEEAAMARTRLMERNQKTAQQKKEEVGEHPSTISHTSCVIMVNLLSRVRLQATSCWERCPWWS